MSTFPGTWTCGVCGALVPVGASHYCPGPRGWVDVRAYGATGVFKDRSANVLADILEELRAIRRLLGGGQP